MIQNRSFNVIVFVALAVVALLTTQQALATSRVLQSEGMHSAAACPIAEVKRASIHSEYVKEMGLTVIRSANGPTGVDGGLIDLLSGYRECSQ